VWGCELNSCGSGQSLVTGLFGFIKLGGRGGYFTGFGTRRISRMDLFHAINFFRSTVSIEYRHHVVSIYNLYYADPGFKSWQKARFFPHTFNFYTVWAHHSILHDFGKMKPTLNKSMVPEKDTNFYNVTITWGTASRGVWHPTYTEEPALREHLADELFNNRTVLVR